MSGIGATTEAIDTCFARADLLQSLCQAGRNATSQDPQKTIDRMSNIFRVIEDEVELLKDELEAAGNSSFLDHDNLKAVE